MLRRYLFSDLEAIIASRHSTFYVVDSGRCSRCECGLFIYVRVPIAITFIYTITTSAITITITIAILFTITLLTTVDYVLLSIFCFPISIYLVSAHHDCTSQIFTFMGSPTTCGPLRSAVVESLQGSH